MARSLTLTPIADVERLTGDATLVAFNVGPEGRPYLLLACNPTDYRVENAIGASFPKVVPDRPQRYRVICLDGDEPTLDVFIEEAQVNAHHVQPLHGDILLVGARSRCRSRDDFDLNGHVFDEHGRHRTSFLLGDGIQHVQTSTAGTIWAGYFDEGVFGNLGWDEPIGASGLIAWTQFGKRLYEFAPPGDLGSIADCYALNVESDVVTWCYYYTDFALVRIRNLAADGHWKMPISGSSCFAISGAHALFNGGYDERELYSLFSIVPGEAPTLLRQFTVKLRDQSGPVRTVARRDAIWMLAGSKIYRLSIEAAMKASSPT